MPQIDWIFILFKINKVGYMILAIESAFYMLEKNDYIIGTFLNVTENALRRGVKPVLLKDCQDCGPNFEEQGVVL